MSFVEEKVLHDEMRRNLIAERHFGSQHVF